MKSGRLLLILLLAFWVIGPNVLAQTQHGISLAWSETNNGDPATGFNVYRATVTGGPYAKITAAPLTATTLTYLDPLSGLTGGTKYFYVVRAVDSLGIESANSSEASAIAPGSNPPAALVATPQ